jgi:hypothetical protein
MDLDYVAARAAQGHPFFRSKLVNLPVEYELAPQVIRRFYEARRERLLNIQWNDAPDNSVEQQAFDLTATVEFLWANTRSDRWEIKKDNLWWKFGNVFIEHQAAAHSQATYELLFADRPYVLLLSAITSLISSSCFRTARGGDGLKATGSLVPVSELPQLALML